jgi:hypothetical protein
MIFIEYLESHFENINNFHKLKLYIFWVNNKRIFIHDIFEKRKFFQNFCGIFK